PEGTVAMAITTEQLESVDYLKVADRRDPLFQGPATIAGNVDAGAALYVQDHVRIDAQASVQAVCSLEGAVVREFEGGLLICRSGRWQSAGGRGGGGYSLNSLSGCVATASNPVTGSCTCPYGYMPVRIA